MKNNSSQVISTATSSKAIAIQLTLCTILLLTALIVNGAVCFLVLQFKSLRTVPNFLLANLACVEFLNTIVNVPLYMVYGIGSEKSPITSVVAWRMASLAILSVLLNLTSMFILVLDRYFAIAHTLKYYVWKSLKKARLAVITAWITAVVAAVMGCAVPLYNVELGKKSLIYYRSAYAAKTNYMYYMSPVLATLIISIAIVTILTLREIRKSKKSEARTVALRRNNGKNEQTITRSASTVLLTFSFYTVCEISAISAITIATRIRALNRVQSQWFFFLGNCLIFGSSSCNVLIYASRSSKFRLALKESWKSFCKKGFITPFNRNHKGKEEGRVYYIKSTIGKKEIYSFMRPNLDIPRRNDLTHKFIHIVREGLDAQFDIRIPKKN